MGKFDIIIKNWAKYYELYLIQLKVCDLIFFKIYNLAASDLSRWALVEATVVPGLGQSDLTAPKAIIT